MSINSIKNELLRDYADWITNLAPRVSQLMGKSEPVPLDTISVKTARDAIKAIKDHHDASGIKVDVQHYATVPMFSGTVTLLQYKNENASSPVSMLIYTDAQNKPTYLVHDPDQDHPLLFHGNDILRSYKTLPLATWALMVNQLWLEREGPEHHETMKMDNNEIKNYLIHMGGELNVRTSDYYESSLPKQEKYTFTLGDMLDTHQMPAIIDYHPRNGEIGTKIVLTYTNADGRPLMRLELDNAFEESLKYADLKMQYFTASGDAVSVPEEMISEHICNYFGAWRLHTTYQHMLDVAPVYQAPERLSTSVARDTPDLTSTFSL